jgi:heptosyltransferase-3
VLLPGGPQASALRFAKLIAAKHTLIRGPADSAAGAHEVEQTCHLLTRMGLHYETPKERIVANQEIITATATQVRSHLGWTPPRIIGIHISARKPSQRWPAEQFIELIQNFPTTPGTAFLLLWAPGSASDPKHPGDDEKAAAIRSQLTSYPVVPVPTQKLDELIGALALCDNVICADGGAMHIAAALGKPIVCLFGHSSTDQWRPWGVPYALLQKDSHQVADISVEEVLHSIKTLISAPC